MKKKILVACLATVFVIFSCTKTDPKPVTPPAEFQISASSLNLSGNKGAVDSFQIKSDLSWTITVSPSNVAWLSIDRTNGTGNTVVHVEVTGDNQTGEINHATITVTPATGSGKQPISMQVNQSLYNLDFKNVWTRLFGGTENDNFQAMVKTSDGGYVLAGGAESADGDLTGNKGGEDFWVVKIDEEGNTLWQTNLGGSTYDRAFSIISTPDGGYALTGSTQSYDGDVTGAHGDGTYTDADVWVVRLDGSGNLLWNKAFGGTKVDYGTGIVNTSDGGLLIQASTASSDGDVQFLHGNLFDFWVFRLDANGNIVWEKTYGGSGMDLADCLLGLPDGNFLVAGYTQSNDGDVTKLNGPQDMWVIKIDPDGNIIWQNSYGGMGTEGARDAVNSPDGAILIGGHSTENGGDVSGNHGGFDYWVLKIGTDGSLLWQKNFGGSGNEFQNSLAVNAEGQFFVSGYAESADGDLTGNFGGQDVWIVKGSSSGDLIWQKSLGGDGDETGNSLYVNTDGSVLILGETTSSNGDFVGNHGQKDAFVIKFDE